MAAWRSLALLLALSALPVAVLAGVEAAAVCEEAAATSDEAWELCPVLGEESAGCGDDRSEWCRKPASKSWCRDASWAGWMQASRTLDVMS